MLSPGPPARPDAVVVDEEAEAKAVVCNIPSLSTPLLVFLLSHLCRQSSMLALHHPAAAIIGTRSSRKSSTVTLIGVTRGDVAPIPLLCHRRSVML
jgi:hypothetical protein